MLDHYPGEKRFVIRIAESQRALLMEAVSSHRMADEEVVALFEMLRDAEAEVDPGKNDPLNDFTA
jgi:hypothetical protein